MKQIFALILSFILTGTGIACDCDWAGDFLTAGVKQNLVVKVKIIGHYKHHQDINEKMTVEIIEKYKGKETRKTITVWGDNGMECRPYVDYFKKGQLYFLALTKIGKDYYLSNCGEFYLTVIDGKVKSEIGVRPELPQIGVMDLKEFVKKIKKTNP